MATNEDSKIPAPPLGKRSEDPRTYGDIDSVPITMLEQASSYWRVAYAKRRRLHDVSIRQILLGQLFIIVFVGAFSVVVEGNKDALLLAGATLILYPSLTDLLVSNSAVLSAVTHHEYDQIVSQKVLRVIVSTARAIVAAILASTLVGIVAGFLGQWLFETPVLETIKLASLAGAIGAVIGLPIIQITTFVSRNLSSNPDEVMPPIENAFFNVIILMAIGLASRILL